MKKIVFNLLLFACFSLNNVTQGQSIVYAEVNKSDAQRMDFEILGKMANNYLIYKETKGNHSVSVFNENMQLVEQVPIQILPKRKELLDISFYAFDNYAYLLYQYQQGNIVYLNAARIEANGKILQSPITLDTTMIAYKSENKIYNSVRSSNGNTLMVFKINKKDRTRQLFSTRRYDAEMQLLSESRYEFPMDRNGDYLNNYSLANNGDFSFIKYHRLTNGQITEASLVIKGLNDDAYQVYPFGNDQLNLDDIKLKIDEAHDRYLMSSFYSDQKKGNITGLYNYGFSKSAKKTVFETKTILDEATREKVNGKRGRNTAFNDYFINNIVVHQDGGFTIGAESMYTTNSGGMWNRWNYWGSPYYFGSPYGFYGGWGHWGGPFWSPYHYYSPFFYRSYWWGGNYDGVDRQTYHAGDIGVFSFDNQGNKILENFIFKNQQVVGSDATISYQILLKGDQMHFLINRAGKISNLDDVTIGESGSRVEQEPITARDKYVDFMPRYGKQVSPSEMIIPYLYKKNISFAKVQY